MDYDAHWVHDHSSTCSFHLFGWIVLFSGVYCLLYCIGWAFLLFGWRGCFFLLIIGRAFGQGQHYDTKSYDLMSFICFKISSSTCI